MQEEIIGTAYLAAAYLEEVGFDKSKLVYVVGSTGITQELDDVGINYLPIGVRHLFECDAGPGSVGAICLERPGYVGGL